MYSTTVSLVERQKGGRVAEMKPDRAEVVFSENSKLKVIDWIGHAAKKIVYSAWNFVQKKKIIRVLVRFLVNARGVEDSQRVKYSVVQVSVNVII